MSVNKNIADILPKDATGLPLIKGGNLVKGTVIKK